MPTTTVVPGIERPGITAVPEVRRREELGGVERAPLLHWASWQVGVDVDAGQEKLFGLRNPGGIP